MITLSKCHLFNVSAYLMDSGFQRIPGYAVEFEQLPREGNSFAYPSTHRLIFRAGDRLGSLTTRDEETVIFFKATSSDVLSILQTEKLYSVESALQAVKDYVEGDMVCRLNKLTPQNPNWKRLSTKEEVYRLDREGFAVEVIHHKVLATFQVRVSLVGAWTILATEATLELAIEKANQEIKSKFLIA